MTKSGSASLADPLLARKGEAAPTGFRRTEPLPPLSRDAANSDGDENPSESAPNSDSLEPGEQASLLACVPLKASFVGLDRPGSDATTKPAAAADIAAPDLAAASSAAPQPQPQRAPAQDTLGRRLLIVLILAALATLGWFGLKTLSQKPIALEPAVTEAAPEPAAPAEAPLTEQPAAAITAPAAELPSETVSPAPQAIEPTFDVVRIEANGDAVIVGRGPAFSELVILDNGIPIGTVQADANGQWILIPDVPLNQGGHNFSLAIKSDSSTVILPEPGAESGESGNTNPAPRPGEGDQSLMDSGSPAAADLQEPASAALPLPLRKPDIQNSLGAEGKLNAGYEIQMVSVPSQDGASQEMLRLKQDFPEILAGLDLRIDEKSYSDQRRQYRVRTGPIADRPSAEELCQRLNAGQQDCLVLKR